MQQDVKNRISLKRFARIIGAYGANPNHWPLLEREGALALLAAEPKARALVEKASKLDYLLSLLPEPKAADAAFLKRLSTLPHNEHVLRPAKSGLRLMSSLKATFGLRTLIPQGLALAMAGVIGVWLGLTLSLPRDKSPVEITDSTYLAFNPDLEKDLEDLR